MRPRRGAWGGRVRRIGAVLSVLGLSSAVGVAGPVAGYHLVRRVDLPTVTGWDYLSLDPVRRDLYVSNNSGIVVVDVDTLRIRGTVPSPPTWPGVGLVHGVAFADDLGRGFVSREQPPSIVTFDLSSLAVLRSTPTDVGTDAIVYDPATRRVFTANGKHHGVHDVTAIDAVTGRALGDVALPGVPEFAVADGRGHLYVNIASASELGRIDTRTLRLTAVWKIAPCRDPSALAVDPVRRRLFAACGNRVMVMVSANDGRVLGSVPTGAGTDAAVFDPGTGDVFASNGAGTLTVARKTRRGRLVLVQQVPTEPGARTMALDAKTHRIFLVTARFAAPPAKPTPANPHGYHTAIPGTARLLIYGR